MPGTRLFRKNHEFLFGTKGLFAEDFLFIQDVLNKYGVQTSYQSNGLQFSSAEELIQYSESEKSFSIAIYGRIGPSDGPFGNLTIAGAISSWEVEIPEGKQPVDLAISRQVFLEVKERLEKRRAIIPDLPWKIARNTIVWVPLLMLVAKALIPSAGISEVSIVGITLSIAFLHYSLAWRERKRWNKQAIVRRASSWKRVKDKWPEIVLVVITAILSAAITSGFNYVIDLVKQAPSTELNSSEKAPER